MPMFWDPVQSGLVEGFDSLSVYTSVIYQFLHIKFLVCLFIDRLIALLYSNA